MRRSYEFLAIAIPVLVLLAGFLFSLTYFGNLEAQFDRLKTDFTSAMNPSDGATSSVKTVEAGMQSVVTSLARNPTPTIFLGTPYPTNAPTSVSTLLPTPTSTPLPLEAGIEGIPHQYQMQNNDGPASLAMALAYWGWKGTQRDISSILRPNPLDKNVMPYELEAFTNGQTEYKAVARSGGDLNIVKAFISAGFPVIVEKGFEGVGYDGWVGHYQLITGYDDAAKQFVTQDSYKGPQYPVIYNDFLSQWRAFNYGYLVVYPADRRQQVLDILDLQAFDNFNFNSALQQAEDDVAVLSGRDLFFSLFNQGSSRVGLKDYTGAASAYDSAFANYSQLAEDILPWRIMWYQTGPYFAYFFTGRYQDVVDLASKTLDTNNDPTLEESFYWRARARIQLGEQETAIGDLRKCLEAHPDFTPCIEELDKLGVNP